MDAYTLFDGVPTSQHPRRPPVPRQAKLRVAEKDPSEQDWSGIEAIFDVILQAFRSDAPE
jgi:hypothetical protein